MSYFCILNYCLGKMYLLEPDLDAGTDQMTGEFRPPCFHVSEIVGNLESGTNDKRDIDINRGETRSGDKTLFTYKKLPLKSFIYVENAISTDHSGEIYEITGERTFTPFMYRIIGELRYSYDLNKTTAVSPNDFQQFLLTGQSCFGNINFDFQEYTKI